MLQNNLLWYRRIMFSKTNDFFAYLTVVSFSDGLVVSKKYKTKEYEMCLRKLKTILNQFNIRLSFFKFYTENIPINYDIVHSLFENRFVLLNKNSNKEVL